MQHKWKKKKTPPLESLDHDVAPKKEIVMSLKKHHKTCKPNHIEKNFKNNFEFIVKTFTWSYKHRPFVIWWWMSHHIYVFKGLLKFQHVFSSLPCCNGNILVGFENHSKKYNVLSQTNQVLLSLVNVIVHSYLVSMFW